MRRMMTTMRRKSMSMNIIITTMKMRSMNIIITTMKMKSTSTIITTTTALAVADITITTTMKAAKWRSMALARSYIIAESRST